MKKLYDENEANFPRLETDKFFVDYNNEYKYNGFMHEAIKFIEKAQLVDPVVWRRFVQQFREDADYDAGWRGEYWGKMMRGASFVYAYTRNPELYDILTQTVKDMMASADENGRISSYGVNHEFDGWDLWERKYVMLGMQYYMEICKDEDFKKEIISSMTKQADYIMSKIGDENEGKKPITSATRHWRGLNSCSILEPFVRLYSLTKEKRFLDFSEYIISTGCTEVVNIFELAHKNLFSPYQYPITKAYEMISCFEGALEYYRITKNDFYKTAAIRFANKILETDFTVIGSAGCTHELFDHSTVRQANTNNERIMQETCVTVTLMKYFYQILLITGKSKFVDAFEISLYNAYLGSINTEKVIEPTLKAEHPDWAIEPLPFDSYSPLTSGTRGNGIGGLKHMSDNHYYGCCACIGSAGIGLVPKVQLMASKDGLVLNLFIDGTVKSTTPLNNNIVVKTQTAYPVDGNVTVTLEMEKDEEFELLVRNPSWSNNTAITVNGELQDVNPGYVSLKRNWKNNDCIKIKFDMTTKVIHPISYGSQILMNNVRWGVNYMIPSYDIEDPIAHRHVALQRGPIMLAQESRLGYDIDNPITVLEENGTVNATISKSKAPYPSIINMDIPLKDGSTMLVTDYASAGKLWTKESKMAVWMLTEE